MKINQPSEVDSLDQELFAVLLSPMLINGSGSLFVLREDGATVSIDGHGFQSKVCFFRPGMEGMYKWLVTNKKVYFLANSGHKFLLEFDEGMFYFTDISSQYSPVFTVRGSSDWFGLNTSKGLTIIKL